MSQGLRLIISTPTALLVDIADATSVRAEDASGGFGVLPGHAEFVTALSDHVLRWRGADDRQHYCAVRGGVMTVRGGATVRVACRHGVLGDDLAKLEAEVRAAAAARAAGESRARVEQTRLHAYAVRQLVRYLRPAGLSESILMSDGEGDAE
ncbi:F0F1 ATP synthase subunit epsilon [Methylocystis sp. IM3]|uniref:F0F1 ATP synthase subunit epsilon n=1 Tax=unclassified Methylocystis TaxID=2625913 RepID=UPI0030FBFDE5